MSRVGCAVRMVSSPPSPGVLAHMSSCRQRKVNAMTPHCLAASQPDIWSSKRRAAKSKAGAKSTRLISSSLDTNTSVSSTHS